MNKTQNQPQINFSDIAAKIPFANKTLLAILLFMWVLDFTTFTTKMLLNDATETWTPNYQIWRIFTASFCLNSIFVIILIAINLYTFLPKLEQRAASITILVNFFISGCIIQFAYTLFVWCLPLGMLKFVGLGDFGGVWFNLIFKYCYFNKKNKIKLCCFPYKFNTNMYPFIFLIFVMLFTFELRFDAIFGMTLGLIQCLFFKGFLIRFKSDLFLSPLSKFSSWVPAESSNTNANPFEGLQEQIEVPRWSQATKDSGVDYFKNKKGVTIG